MKLRYYITATGYTIHPQDTGFETLKEAKEALREAANDELRRARCKWKTAHAARSPLSVTITANRDTRSALWTNLSIVQA